MGRVKDYILQAGNRQAQHVRFVALVSRRQGHAVWSLWDGLTAILRIWWAQLTGRLALVHVNVGDRGSLFRKGAILLAARLVGARIVLHLHAAELLQFYETLAPPVRAVVRLMFRVADVCVVLGAPWQRWLIDRLGIDPARIEILYNGVPGDFPARPERAAGAPFRILFLGNLLERKGVHDLLHALARIPAETPPWIARIAGGGDIERYTAMAAELGITARVEFCGWVDKPGARDLLITSDCLILPSYDEGLPLVILEALASGLPVVATPVGSIPEVLEEAKTILFVAPGDRDAIAATLARLIGDPALYRTLSVEGRALYDRSFTLDAFTARLFTIYRRHCNVDV